jgi:predicted aspartyl protease
VKSYPFTPGHGPIFLEAEATGPSLSANLNLVLDTGATRSLIRRASLIHLGIDPDQSPRRVQMTTGSTVEVVPIVILTRFSALGQHRFGFPVIAHTMPENAAVDGLLGLDFLRGLHLAIDFRTGLITLS